MHTFLHAIEIASMLGATFASEVCRELARSNLDWFLFRHTGMEILMSALRGALVASTFLPQSNPSPIPGLLPYRMSAFC